MRENLACNTEFFFFIPNRVRRNGEKSPSQQSRFVECAYHFIRYGNFFEKLQPVAVGYAAPDKRNRMHEKSQKQCLPREYFSFNRKLCALCVKKLWFLLCELQLCI